MRETIVRMDWFKNRVKNKINCRAKEDQDSFYAVGDFESGDDEEELNETRKIYNNVGQTFSIRGALNFF